MKAVLYVLLGVLAVVHAANAHVPLLGDSVDSAIQVLVPVSWWMVVVMVVWAGIAMLRSARDVSEYEGKADDLLRRLEVANASPDQDDQTPGSCADQEDREKIGPAASEV